MEEVGRNGLDDKSLLLSLLSTLSRIGACFLVSLALLFHTFIFNYICMPRVVISCSFKILFSFVYACSISKGLIFLLRVDTSVNRY